MSSSSTEEILEKKKHLPITEIALEIGKVFVKGLEVIFPFLFLVFLALLAYGFWCLCSWKPLLGFPLLGVFIIFVIGLCNLVSEEEEEKKK